MVKYILTGVLSAASVGATGFNYVTNLQTKVRGLETQNAAYASAINTKDTAIEAAIKTLEAARTSK
jgi:hypothetical protein